MGCCTSTVNPSKDGIKAKKSTTASHYENGNEDAEQVFFKKTSCLIPYSDNDPIEEKIKKIYLRWRMNRSNIIEYMSMLKFDSILQISIKNHLPPDDDIGYDSIEHLMHILQQNKISKSIFCQYWKMEKYISSTQVIKRHIDVMFQFKKWKVEEQLSYVNNSDLQLFDQYNPVINTKTSIKQYMKQGDILVVLRPRWHDYRKTVKIRKNHNNHHHKDDSIIKVHSFSPFTSTNKSNQNKLYSPSLQPSSANKKSAFKLKVFPNKSPKSISQETTTHTPHSKEASASAYNGIYSDNEDILAHNNTLTAIKLTDFHKYITMQAMCLAVTVSERQLLTLRTHSKLKSMSSLHNINAITQFRPSKKLTDLGEEEETETNVIHHDNTTKHNRFYFTLCTDRTSALLKIQELVIKINNIIDDLSFLYSIVVQASMHNMSPSEYIEQIKDSHKQHLLSLSSMQQASFINICGGLAKYWSDIDDQRSIIKRVQSALQFSALGSVFMYPKDYAARTKWKVGDAVMIFKQDIEKWCPGKITKLYKEDDIMVKFAVLHSNYTPTNTQSKHNDPPLKQGNEENNSEVAFDYANNSDVEDIKLDLHPPPNPGPPPPSDEIKMAAKVTFSSVNVLSNDGVRGSVLTDYTAPFSPTQRTPRGQSKSSSRIDIMDANKLAKIDFEDATLEQITLNRYDRNFVRPMIIKNRMKRASLSVTIDMKANRTSELLDMLTGLGNAVRLNERLRDICDDNILCGLNEINDSDINNTAILSVVKAKNIHPIALMLIEIDQLSSKINLSNRHSEMMKQENKYLDEKYNEDTIMAKVSKVVDNIGTRFNLNWNATTQSQLGSYDQDIQSLLDSQSSFNSQHNNNISVNEQGKKGNKIKSESFRYGHNVFALLLHNCEVAKSLLISRFLQKEIMKLCRITREFRYDDKYLTVSMAIANLHYNDSGNAIIDSYRSWYKRCSDALKTIRYEGGNGVTHADVLFGVQSTPVNNSRYSHSNASVHNSDNAVNAQLGIGIGILHTAGSATSEPGIAQQFQNSLNENNFNNFASFNNNLIQQEIHKQKMPPLPPPRLSPSCEDPVVNDDNNNNQGATSPLSQHSDVNKTVTWITGRDRKYTFV